MEIQAYKTDRILPNASLESILNDALPPLAEKEIVVITSKIISLCEGRVTSKTKVKSKLELIYKEASAVLRTKFGTHLTLKNGILIPAAGIDESNVEESYVLYPKNIPATAQSIWEYLRSKHRLKNLGVIISDSHTTIGRRGVLGIGIGWCGFNPVYNYIGKEDCFGRKLKMTYANHLDALAIAAVHVMGEGNESTPLAIIRNASKVEFQSRPPTEEELNSILIPPEEDLYGAIFEHPDWIVIQETSSD